MQFLNNLCMKLIRKKYTTSFNCYVKYHGKHSDNYAQEHSLFQAIMWQRWFQDKPTRKYYEVDHSNIEVIN